MNIQYQHGLRLNEFMSSFKPKGNLSGSSILKIINLKQETGKLQENYFTAFEQVMHDNNIEKDEKGAYSWEDKKVSEKIQELLKAETTITSVGFMTEEEFVTIVDGTVELENLAFIQTYLMKSDKKEEKKTKTTSKD